MHIVEFYLSGHVASLLGSLPYFPMGCSIAGVCKTLRVVDYWQVADTD